MRRLLIILAVALGGCIDYELNPDAGWDAGPGQMDGSFGLPDGSYGLPGLDGGVDGRNCEPGPRKGLCIPMDAGSGTGSGYVPPADFPGSGAMDDPGAAVLFLVRIERGTVNLASRYTELIHSALDGLRAERIKPFQVAVASLYSGEILWSPGSGNSLAFELAAAASAHVPSPTPPCTVDALGELASTLPDALDRSGGYPFRAPFSALAVFLIDSGARPYSPDQEACSQQGAAAISYFSADPAGWVANVEARPLPRPQVRFVIVATPEDVTSTDLKERCSRGGMPAQALDVIEASPVPFFGPFVNGLDAQDPGLATPHDLCTVYVSDFERTIRWFAKGWRTVLEAQPSWY